MVHRDNVERYPGTLAELAGEIGDLRYDALATFLRALSAKLRTDAEADTRRGRPKLAAALRRGADAVAAAHAEIESAWKIAALHMRDSAT